MLDWLSFPAVLSHIAISGEWPLKDIDPTVGFLKGLKILLDEVEHLMKHGVWAGAISLY